MGGITVKGELKTNEKVIKRNRILPVPGLFGRGAGIYYK